MDKFQNKYRIPTNRLRNYDYGSNGCYYVTLCTKNREHYFGKIIDAEMQFTQIGQIACQYWLNIPNHFPFVVLDEFVIMPNHIHGILFFNKPVAVVETDNYPSLHEPNPSLHEPNPSLHKPNKFGKQTQNLGSVIRGFKSSLRRYANENNIEFVWQERYYDRIIFNEQGLNNVRYYIINNPSNWGKDEMNNNKI